MPSGGQQQLSQCPWSAEGIRTTAEKFPARLLQRRLWSHSRAGRDRMKSGRTVGKRGGQRQGYSAGPPGLAKRKQRLILASDIRSLIGVAWHLTRITRSFGGIERKKRAPWPREQQTLTRVVSCCR